jgi:hypothetical protein
MAQGNEQRLSALAQVIAARERRCYDFETNGFLGLAGKPILTIKVRVATKGEQDRAVLGAHKYVEELAKDARVDAKVAAEDRDILSDAKTCFILFEVCRDAEDPNYPAFPGPRWMIDHLSTDEIGVLLNCYTEVLRATGTIDFDLSTERVEALSQALAATADSDAPNAYLARYTREQVTEICIRLAVMLDERRDEAAGADAG